MNNKLTAGDGTARTSLEEINLQLEQRLWNNVMLLVTVLTPLSLLRAVSTGWLPLYSVHVTVLLIMSVVHLLRARLPRAWCPIIALSYMQFVAALSLLTLGQVGFGSLWLVVVSYLVGVMYGLRAGLVAVAVNMGLVLIAALLFTSGKVTLPMDVDAYQRTITAWVLALFMITVMPWTLLNSIGLHRDAIRHLLTEASDRRREIEHLAMHDSLTGLAQPHVAHDRLEAAIERTRGAGRQVAVIFIDLDGFKQVNDLHGHRAGDSVLRSISNMLKEEVREGDTVARLGGDEFLVVLDDLEAGEPARKIASEVADRILKGMRRKIQLGEVELTVGASLGIALFPEHGGDVKSLQQAADAAMYEVKWSGKDGFAFCGAEAAERRLSRESTAGQSRLMPRKESA